MPKMIKKLVDRPLRPNKLLGQNFLRDKNILRKITAAADLTKDDTVLEVGPGEGFLTEELARAAGRVVAVEKDKLLAAQLKIKFADRKNIEIIEGDILKILNDLPLYKRGIEGDLKNMGKIHPNPPFTKEGKISYKVVANIPYYLTSHLIRLLLENANPPQDIVLMIQKEVAQRICARPPKMSLLAVSAQFYAEPRIIAKVSRGAFYPRPNVDSAIIKITPRPVLRPVAASSTGMNEASFTGPHSKYRHIEIPEFFKILRAGFSHPRKQLLNNLSAELGLPRERVGEILISAGLTPNQRAETLSVADWLKLTKALNQ